MAPSPFALPEPPCDVDYTYSNRRPDLDYDGLTRIGACPLQGPLSARCATLDSTLPNQAGIALVQSQSVSPDVLLWIWVVFYMLYSDTDMAAPRSLFIDLEGSSSHFFSFPLALIKVTSHLSSCDMHSLHGDLNNPRGPALCLVTVTHSAWQGLRCA